MDNFDLLFPLAALFLYLYIYIRIISKRKQKKEEDIEPNYDIPPRPLDLDTKSHSDEQIIHTEDEVRQHDKGKVLQGKQHVHTDDETFVHDKSKIILDVKQESKRQNMVFRDQNSDYTYDEESYNQIVTEDQQNRLQAIANIVPKKKKLTHQKLVRAFIMSEILNKPKGLR